MFKILLKNAFISFLLLMSIVSGTTTAQDQKLKANKAYPPTIESTKVETYRKVAETELKIWIFESKEKAAKPRPAIVFFFGGGWTSGTPSQFVPQSKYLAERGMVAIVADYRVSSRNKAKPIDCVSDAKACVRYIRTNAVRLGIDPDRIAAGGGSAGGHLAAATATLPGLEAAGEDLKVSSVPNALVLFNPALVLAPIPGLMLEGFLANSTKERFGCEPEAFSPAHHVKKGVPPTIIFHGKADSTVPYSSAVEFSERMNKAGNRCQLVGFEGEGHGFFNNKKMKETLDQADEFLVSLGYLPARKQ
jgi:acetyl esterase/lipase